MLNRIALLFVGLLSLSLYGQDEMPNNIDDVITWNFEITYTDCDEATITMRVAQKNGWHIYSQIQPDGAIPLPTSFDYNVNENFKLSGKTKEYGAELVDNDGFPERSFHGNRAKFEQRIKILSKEDFQLKLDYGYMACKTACLPPEFRDITLDIKGTNNIDCENLEGAATEVEGGNETEGEGEAQDSTNTTEAIVSPIGFQTYAYIVNETEYELIVKPKVNEGYF